jgi:hypothetical protein
VDITELWPPFIRGLSRDEHGRPIPLFLMQTDLGLMERRGWLSQCVTNRKCWVCGRKLPRDCGFALNALHVIMALSTDPPAHMECLRFGLERSKPDGVMALWETYDITRAMANLNGLGHFNLGKPRFLEWFGGDVKAALDAAAQSLMEFVAGDSDLARDIVTARIKRADALLKRWPPE